ncbi:uncharacterized protein FTOL_10112 [Fusarium torulosum]|uniref:Uncharacterized protein n=1 Tax=Fusarium torulosum TaxID=33205 RepID=A0AAE8MFN5_9HYPO|nr:uncharacterized protein FTOL_10112 [Fusarium torulosum]
MPGCIQASRAVPLCIYRAWSALGVQQEANPLTQANMGAMGTTGPPKTSPPAFRSITGNSQTLPNPPTLPRQP